MNPVIGTTFREALDDATGDASDATPPSVRRAAWLLHGLPDVDRTWLLDQLDAAQRDAVVPALRELAELGLAPRADASPPRGTTAPATAVATHALAGPGQPAPSAASSASAPAADTSTRPSPRALPAWPSLWTLTRVVRCEPEPVALAILRAQGVHHRRVLLWSLPASRRRRLQAALGDRRVPVASGLDAALRRALAPPADEAMR